MYEARWTTNGKQHRKSTGIKVAGAPGYSAAKAKILAQQAADSMELVTSRTSPVNKVIDAVRAVAEAEGMAGNIPTVREYMATIREMKADRSQKNRERAHTLFLEFLGSDADMRIDLITPQRCREFIRWSARHGRVGVGTVMGYKNIISAVFNHAVEVDDILMKNPMRKVNVREEYTGVAGPQNARPMKRVPFTPEELYKLIHEAPAPWCDMVAVSWYCLGLRLSDVCRMRWDSIDFDTGIIDLSEIKTTKRRVITMCTPLRALLEKIRAAQVAGGEEGEAHVFPGMAAQYEINQSATISTRFTSILRAMGIVSDTMAKGKEGEKHRMSPKSFHSIRHTAVSVLRSNPAFTPDMVRDAVGHSSEAVEQGYYTATMAQRAKLAEALVHAVEQAHAPGDGLPPYPASA